MPLILICDPFDAELPDRLNRLGEVTDDPGRLGEAGAWLKKELTRTELFGKTLGLVGLGRIGRVMAERADSFGMTVRYYHPRVSDFPGAVREPDLGELFALSDYISLHLPLRPETVDLIDADVLARARQGVVVINTGRARTVHAEAMAEALRSGRVAAYATDVWSSDPPPADDPILAAPNVLMVPHLGASTRENLRRIGVEVEKIIETFLARET